MKKKVRYICLDDETATVQGILTRVASNISHLEIKTLPPVNFEDQLTQIVAGNSDGTIHGVILDLRLDRRIPAGGERTVKYTAPGLAAQLRNWQATNPSKASFPIILWSVESLLEKGFYPDMTNRDLFDFIYTKKNVSEDDAEVARELVEFASAYQEIFGGLSKSTKVTSILKPPANLILDPRLDDEFDFKAGCAPTFLFAKFVFEELICQPGPLIDTDLLLARLGLALDSPHREEVLAALPKRCSYKGPYHTVWPRWWAGTISEWWTKVSPDRPNLDRIIGPERVAALRAYLNLPGLKAAVGKPGESQYFSTVCRVTNRPLNPIDGYLIKGKEPRPWQLRSYVSKEVALDPAKYNFRTGLDPMEIGRLQKIQAHGAKKA